MRLPCSAAAGCIRGWGQALKSATVRRRHQPGAGDEVAAVMAGRAEVNSVQRVEIHCVAANVRSAAVPRWATGTRQRWRGGWPMATDNRDEMIWTLLRTVQGHAARRDRGL